MSTFKTTIQIAPECSIKHPCFPEIRINSQNFILNSVRMHLDASLISSLSRQFQLFLENKFRVRTPNSPPPPSIFLFSSKSYAPVKTSRTVYCWIPYSCYCSEIYPYSHIVMSQELVCCTEVCSKQMFCFLKSFRSKILPKGPWMLKQHNNVRHLRGKVVKWVGW